MFDTICASSGEPNTPEAEAVTKTRASRPGQICRTDSHCSRVWLSFVHRRNARRASFAKRQLLTADLWLFGMAQFANPIRIAILAPVVRGTLYEKRFVARLPARYLQRNGKKDRQASRCNVAIINCWSFSRQTSTSLISQPFDPPTACVCVFRFRVFFLQLALSNLCFQPSRHSITTLHCRRDCQHGTRLLYTCHTTVPCISNYLWIPA